MLSLCSIYLKQYLVKLEEDLVYGKLCTTTGKILLTFLNIFRFMTFFDCAWLKQHIFLAPYYLIGLFPLILFDFPFPNMVELSLHTCTDYYSDKTSRAFLFRSLEPLLCDALFFLALCFMNFWIFLDWFLCHLVKFWAILVCTFVNFITLLKLNWNPIQVNIYWLWFLLWTRLHENMYMIKDALSYFILKWELVHPPRHKSSKASINPFLTIIHIFYFLNSVSSK